MSCQSSSCRCQEKMEKAKLEAKKRVKESIKGDEEKNTKCFNKRGILNTMLAWFSKDNA